MYDELVKRLRETSIDFGELDDVSVMLLEAADAIEEMQAAEKKFLHIISVLETQVEQLKREARWIPVTERLPDIGKDVLVMVHWRDYSEDMMCYGRKYKTRWYLWNGELGELLKGFDITHWMPLPDPPKEET